MCNFGHGALYEVLECYIISNAVTSIRTKRISGSYVVQIKRRNKLPEIQKLLRDAGYTPRRMGVRHKTAQENGTKPVSHSAYLSVTANAKV